VPDRKDPLQGQCVRWQKLHPIARSVILYETEELFCQALVAKTLSADLR